MFASVFSHPTLCSGRPMVGRYLNRKEKYREGQSHVQVDSANHL